MYLKNKKGLTLIEGLVGISLLAITLIAVMGTFVVGRISVPIARHRQIAMNIIRNYLEQETQAGYSGGGYTSGITSSPIDVTNDNVVYSITANPWPAANNIIGTSGYYKTVGFVATWTESALGNNAAVSCSEKAVVYIAQH